MIAGMEDSGTLQALTFLKHGGASRLATGAGALRSVSNYDREPNRNKRGRQFEGRMAAGNYSAYMPSLEAGHSGSETRSCGTIVEHWD